MKVGSGYGFEGFADINLLQNQYTDALNNYSNAYKSYSSYGNNQTDIAPFTQENWNLIMTWYWRIAGILGGPILIAIVILAWKMIVAGISPDKRNEVKDNLMRLFFGAAAIGIAPIFVKFILMLNNSLVKLLVANSHGSLDDLLGNSLLTSINTGNAIATAIVIAMFAYLFVKVNIKFIIRQFTLIVFTIFTPIVAVFWIINKRTIASSIWFGQIVINAFMQFVYTFLFLIYLTFLPKSAGWAVSLLWAMMILPLADALQNTMQNLVSRIAGVDNEALANKGIGMGAAMGQTVRTIAYQFKGENTNVDSGNDFIGKVVKRASGGIKAEPIASSSYESYSQNFAEKARPVNQTNINNETKQTQNTTMVGKENNTETPQSTSGFRKAFNVGKEFMNLGMYMAEGRNFKTNESNINNNRIYNRPNINNTRKEDMEESTNKIISIEQDDAND